MLINTEKMITITEANRNFSKFTKMVDEMKAVIVMKNNKPQYIMIEFEEFSRLAEPYSTRVNDIADQILYENIDAFKELAK
jgi:antitoxin Phd